MPVVRFDIRAYEIGLRTAGRHDVDPLGDLRTTECLSSAQRGPI